MNIKKLLKRTTSGFVKRISSLYFFNLFIKLKLCFIILRPPVCRELLFGVVAAIVYVFVTSIMYVVIITSVVIT